MEGWSRSCEASSSIRRLTLDRGSRVCCLNAGSVFGRCSYPRLDCIGEGGRRAKVGGEREVHDQLCSSGQRRSSSAGPHEHPLQTPAPFTFLTRIPLLHLANLPSCSRRHFCRVNAATPTANAAPLWGTMTAWIGSTYLICHYARSGRCSRGRGIGIIGRAGRPSLDHGIEPIWRNAVSRCILETALCRITS
jgi:hypothetical protein